MSSVVQQKYNLDIKITFHHSYDRKDKAENAPATSGMSEFEFRRVERLEHLTFDTASRFLAELNDLVDKYEKEEGQV